MHWLTYHHFRGNWVTAAVKHGGCGGLRSWWRWWISSSFASWFSRKFWLCWWWWKFFLAFFIIFFFFWIQLSWTWWCLLAGHALKQTISCCYFHFWLVVEVFVLSFKKGCFGVKIFNEDDPERKIEALWCWMLNFCSLIDF